MAFNPDTDRDNTYEYRLNGGPAGGKSGALGISAAGLVYVKTAGQGISVVNEAGTVLLHIPETGGGGIGNVTGAGTLGTLTKWTGATSIGDSQFSNVLANVLSLPLDGAIAEGTVGTLGIINFQVNSVGYIKIRVPDTLLIDPPNETLFYKNRTEFNKPIYLPDGTLLLPAFTFTSDPTSGLYLTGTGTAIAYGGAEKLRLSSAAAVFTDRVIATNGSAANCSFSFASDAGSGIFRAGSQILGLAAGGTELLRLAAAVSAEFTGVTITIPDNGPGGALALQFKSGGNTGWYFDGSQVILDIGGTHKNVYGISSTNLRPKLLVNGTVGDNARSTLEVVGSIQTKYRASAAAIITLGIDDSFLAVTAGGATVVNLPTAFNIEGREYTIKKVDATAFVVTVTPNGAETIDGAATKSLAAQWAAVTIVSDGSNWLIKGNI